mmetsp:Transcript_697/g.528  ORF Transcript_697/g.528 Transcript_697/m.528 type:complete len:129 (+) Transcript_697:961-1347(+)
MNTQKKFKVLIVDDEKGYVDVLANRLKRRGFDVDKAYSGVSAIEKLRKIDFDIAILDLKMEDMDGIEVLKIFKKVMPQMQVVMVTGHGSSEAATKGIEYGAFDYLAKPCEFSELLETIKKALKIKDAV